MNFSIYDFTSFTQWIDKFLYDNLPAFWAVVVEMTIIGLVVLLFYALVGLFLVYAERKVCAFMQNRVGPNRVTRHQLTQPADVLLYTHEKQALPQTSRNLILSLQRCNDQALARKRRYGTRACIAAHPCPCQVSPGLVVY